MKKFLMSLAAIVLVVGMFAPVTFADDHSEGDMAMVRVLHASPDAPAVDVYVDGNVVVEGAGFKSATDYMELSAGEHMVEIYAAGTMGEQDPVISTNLTVEAGMAYTLATINNVDNLELKALQDEMTVSEGMAKVRVGNLIPNAPAVDVAMVEGDALFSGAEFSMVTDYNEVEEGTYDLEIRTNSGTPTQLIDLSGTMLESGKVYSAFAVGTVANPEVIILENTVAITNSNDSDTSKSGSDSDTNESETSDSESSSDKSKSDSDDSDTTNSDTTDSEEDDSMPSSMPETGFGGTADSGNNALLYASILGVIAMGVGFVLFRRRSEA
ncbi:DUF4397 domain-containing protein [Filobacillus milosensis]|uniref:DUF4397 domain-containing protein n=1 Tax=Filobacillus milosensis TaxID=94137 RepID=UPI001E36C2D5|nr:DUF4397 domain-containing protein [Filobacillus milosensis]